LLIQGKFQLGTDIQEFILLRLQTACNNRCRNRIACCSSYCTSKQTRYEVLSYFT